MWSITAIGYWMHFINEKDVQRLSAILLLTSAHSNFNLYTKSEIFYLKKCVKNKFSYISVGNKIKFVLPIVQSKLKVNHSKSVL